MAQNVTVQGASYADVPSVLLPKTGGGSARFDDASVTTATAADVASGKIFLAANGTITTGTNSGGGGGFLPLIHTETLGTFSSVPTSATDTGKSISLTPSQINGYDLLLFEVVRDSFQNGYLAATYTVLALRAYDGYSANKTAVYTMAQRILIRISSNIWQNSTYTSAYGFYVINPTISSGTLTAPISMRRSASYTGSMDGTYVVNVYGIDLYGHLNP